MEIVNKYTYAGKTGKEIVVMRPSALGNPFSHMDRTLAQFKVANREEAVQRYGIWLKQQIVERNPSVLKALRQIKPDSILVCCCAPKLCHATMIVRAVEWLEKHPEYK